MSALPEKNPTDWSVKDLTEDERRNLLGFFALALKVDKRVNPDRYKRTDDDLPVC